MRKGKKLFIKKTQIIILLNAATKITNINSHHLAIYKMTSGLTKK